MGIFGLVVVVAVWIIVTVLTGYFLGVGIWAAAPRSWKYFFDSSQSDRVMRIQEGRDKSG
jgi:hypothetical protein